MRSVMMSLLSFLILVICVYSPFSFSLARVLFYFYHGEMIKTILRMKMAFSWPRFKSLWKGINHINANTNTNQFIFILNLLIFCKSKYNLGHTYTWRICPSKSYCKSTWVECSSSLFATILVNSWVADLISYKSRLPAQCLA